MFVIGIDISMKIHDILWTCRVWNAFNFLWSKFQHYACSWVCNNAFDHLFFFFFLNFNLPINYNSVLFQKNCWLFYIPSQYVCWMICGLTKLIVSEVGRWVQGNGKSGNDERMKWDGVRKFWTLEDLWDWKTNGWNETWNSRKLIIWNRMNVGGFVSSNSYQKDPLTNHL